VVSRTRHPPHPNPLPAGEREHDNSPLPSGERKASLRAGEGDYKPKPSQQIRHRAKTLRRNATDAEKKLWHALRDGQLLGIKFRRQHPIDEYIVDFAAPALKLIIELDGGQHNEAPNQACDAARTAALQNAGWRVVRFWNNEVHENIEGVLQVISHALTRNQPC
jgi:very-short-patch-repair endonuclease